MRFITKRQGIKSQTVAVWEWTIEMTQFAILQGVTTKEIKTTVEQGIKNGLIFEEIR